MKNQIFCKKFFKAAQMTLQSIEQKKLTLASKILAEIKKKNGRLFIMGSGGGAGHASHAVNDFRKIAGIESYCPSDNASELTARINDEGWETCFLEWLKVSKINKNDALLVFSVGGGCTKKRISMNLVNAMIYSKSRKAKIIAVTGRDGGVSKKLADVLILLTVNPEQYMTPLVESFQALVWHCLVSFPTVQKNKTKW